MNRIIKFRVYPESVHGFYFDVSIHPTVERMRKFAERTKAMRGNFDNAEAAVCGFSKGEQDENGRIAWSKTLGAMVFYQKRLGMEIITHECTHAALRWMEAKKFNALDRSGDYVEGEASDNEERFCYALGRIAAQIAEKCWEHNLYE